MRKDRSRQFLEALYSEKLDDDDERVQEIKARIDNHPERAVILDDLANPAR